MTFDLATIVTIVLGLVAAVASGFWLKAKGKFRQLKTLVKEGYDVVQASIDALDDDALTAEEIAGIKKEAQELVAAFKALIGR